jgi:hypothetical protein
MISETISTSLRTVLFILRRPFVRIRHHDHNGARAGYNSPLASTKTILWSSVNIRSNGIGIRENLPGWRGYRV